MSEMPVLRILSTKQVAERLGVNVRTIQRMVDDGRIISPVELTAGRIGFYEHEINEHLASLPRIAPHG